MPSKILVLPTSRLDSVGVLLESSALQHIRLASYFPARVPDAGHALCKAPGCQRPQFRSHVQ